MRPQMESIPIRLPHARTADPSPGELLQSAREGKFVADGHFDREA